MLESTKHDLKIQAQKLVKPYEQYSIDELADAYCAASDSGDEVLKNVYISALILRFWYTIDKMYRSNTVAPCLEREDFFWWLYEAIEYACKYRGWQDPSKKLNAQQCINRCISTIKLQKYYDLRLDKNKTVNYTNSLEAPMGGDGDDAVTLADLLEADSDLEDSSDDDAVIFIQNYINNNKIVEAIIFDTIAFNDTQKHFKKTIKTVNQAGEDMKYVEHSSEFWPYKLVQIMSHLPKDYSTYFLKKYNISEEKLNAVLDVVNKANNQKLYRYLRKTLAEAKETFVY